MGIISRKLGFSIAAGFHSIWMMLLTFWLLNWYFVHWDEGEILQFGPIVKKYVLGLEDKPENDELMFVNVSHDNQLVDLLDEYGFPLGNETITDRSKLANFLGLLSKINNHKAIICDIRFDLASPQDSILQASFDSLSRYVVSNHMTDDRPDKPVIKVINGISDYSFSGGSFFKFKYIFTDTVKSVPIVLSEQLTQKNYWMKNGFLTDGELSYFNVFITDFLVRPFDLFQSEKPYFTENLGNLLFLDSKSIAEITKDRIIVIGDFDKYDIHDTILGEVPGPMILLNAYLNLERGDNRFSISYLLFLFFAYFLVSLYLIVPNDVLEARIHRWAKKESITNFITNVMSYFIMLIIILTISYFVFGVLLNVLWLTLYLWLAEKVLDFGYRRYHLQ